MYMYVYPTGINFHFGNCVTLPVSITLTFSGVVSELKTLKKRQSTVQSLMSEIAVLVTSYGISTSRARSRSRSREKVKERKKSRSPSHDKKKRKRSRSPRRIRRYRRCNFSCLPKKIVTRKLMICFSSDYISIQFISTIIKNMK